MISRWTILALATAAATLTGCQSEDEAIAEELWTEIEGATFGYTAWNQFPGYEDPIVSSTHGGYTVVTYINEVVNDQLSASWSGEVPDGSVIVKESYYSKDGTLTGGRRNITVMKKIAGYAPEYNDWYFINFNPDGTVPVLETGPIMGLPANCVDCHKAYAYNDYIQTYTFGQD